MVSTLKRTRQCLFCENRADSREHVWPQWVLDRLRRPRLSQVIGHQGGKRVQWSGVNPAIRARMLCIECNGTFGRGLEAAALPTIGALIQDFALTLDAHQQRIAAQWAVKMAMMAEAFRDLTQDSFFFTQQQREAFRATHALPAGVVVWLARYIGAQYSFIGANDASFAQHVIGRAPDMYISTFAAGRLAFQVMALRLSPKQGDATGLDLLENEGPWNDATLQVPAEDSTPIRWPPRLSFSDDEPLPLNALRLRWSTIEE